MQVKVRAKASHYKAVKDLICLAGYDAEAPAMLETPKRFISTLLTEFRGPLEVNTPEELFKQFDGDGYSGMIVVKDIEFSALCEHHLMPYFGKAAIGYVSTGPVLGLSKLARILNYYAHRVTIQERITMQVADLLYDNPNLGASGVIVVLRAMHTCMIARGVRQSESETITSEVRGVFYENKKGSKDEFFQLLRS